MMTVFAQGDAYEVLHDYPLAGSSVLENDSHSELEQLIATLVSGPEHGTLSLSSSGSFTYTPDEHFVGTDSFTYSASFGSESDQATATITVTNNAPNAENGGESVLHDQPLSSSVYAYDLDMDNLTYALGAGPYLGTLNLSSGGNFTYTPSTHFIGSENFTFTASDGVATDTGTFTINVTNNAPTADDSTEQVNRNDTLTSSVTAFDLDVDSLTYSVASGPSHGLLGFDASGGYSYTPAPAYVGTDSFTFLASDGVASDTGTVTITVVDNRVHYHLDYSFGGDADEADEIPAILVLTLSPPAGSEGVTVNWSPITVPGDEEEPLDWATGADFYNSSGSYTFAPGESVKHIEIKPVNDTTVEKNEKMRIEIPGDNTDDYVLLTSGTGSFGLWSTMKVLDNEWRFVNPGSEFFGQDEGHWFGEPQSVIAYTEQTIWYGLVPIGDLIGIGHVTYQGFDELAAAVEVHAHHYGGLGGTDTVVRQGNMQFLVHPQTGDIVRADGVILTGNSADDWIQGDIGHGWTVNNFGPNEKRVAVTWELGFGYDANISATTVFDLFDQIHIEFTSGDPNYQHGVETRQYSLIARNRITDDNTGLEWND